MGCDSAQGRCDTIEIPLIRNRGQTREEERADLSQTSTEFRQVSTIIGHPLGSGGRWQRHQADSGDLDRWILQLSAPGSVGHCRWPQNNAKGQKRSSTDAC
jgi:hypothetical protein